MLDFSCFLKYKDLLFYDIKLKGFICSGNLYLSSEHLPFCF